MAVTTHVGEAIPQGTAKPSPPAGSELTGPAAVFPSQFYSVVDDRKIMQVSCTSVESSNTATWPY